MNMSLHTFLTGCPRPAELVHAVPGEPGVLPEAPLLFQFLSRRHKDCTRNVFAILLAEQLLMDAPSAQVIKEAAI